MPVTQKDTGWRALQKRLDRTRPRVKVGIFGEAAAAKGADGKATVGQIANAHEHGLGVPRRSWLGGTVDANEADIFAGLRKAAAMVLDPKAPAGLEVKLLAQVGQHIAGLARLRISSGISPALSPRYLRRKLARYPGATTPLIASGQMWGAIGSVVEGSAVAVAAQRKAARKAAKAALARRRAIRRLNQVSRTLSRAGARLGKNAERAIKKTQRKLARKIFRTEAQKFRAAAKKSRLQTRALIKKQGASNRRAKKLARFQKKLSKRIKRLF